MAAGAIAGLAMIVGAIASALINNRNNKKAADEAWARQQEQTLMNQRIGMENWENTNAEAQRKQFEKAGLSVGMMYSGSGGHGLGATSQGTAPKRDVSEIDLSEGPGMALQATMQKAQIKNIEANTAKTQVETEKIGGPDTQKTVAETQNVIQKTKNEQVNEKILQYERELKSIETNVQTFNQWEVIDQMRTETRKVNAELQSAVAKGEIDEQTAEATITQIRTNTIEQQLRIQTQEAGLLKTAQEIEASKAGIQKITAEVEKIAADIRKGRNELQLERQKVINDILRTDFQVSDPSQIKQWTNIIMEAAQTGAQIGIATKLLKK